MDERAVKFAWFLLAIIHAMPAAVLFQPELAMRLYGVDPAGPVGLLIVHRGALFLAIMAAALVALIDPAARRVSSLTVGISITGFLGVYGQGGMPEGPLRTIALVDIAALLPLTFVTYRAWRRPALTAPSPL